MPATPLHNQPIPFITLPNWVKAAAQCGFNIQPIFRDLGIQTDLIHLESATIEPSMLLKVMEACIARSPKQHFPFVLGETFAFEYLPDIETFLTTSPTLRDAARVFDWVRELINPMINVQLIEEGDIAALTLMDMGENPDLSPPYFRETIFACVLKFGRMLLGEPVPFYRLLMRHPMPSYAAAYEEYFRVPVLFGQPRNALEIHRELLDRPLNSAFPALHQQAEYRVEQRLAQLPRKVGLIAAIEQTLGAQPRLLGQGIEQIAAALELHPRTLQRRLQEQGEGFAELQSRVRYRLACEALHDASQDIESISERLGFSDRRSFTRAFVRWSGLSPSVFRKQPPGP
jgi:AraC-like DNA-binding protein